MGYNYRNKMENNILTEKLNLSAKNVVEKFKQLNHSISIAESCTGGLICSALTENPGSSKVLLEGFVVYTEQSKLDLGVDEFTIKNCGIVSRQTAKELAICAKKRTNSTVSIGITGWAGPDGGDVFEPNGVVWIGWILSDNSEKQLRLDLAGHSRADIKKIAATIALNGLLS